MTAVGFSLQPEVRFLELLEDVIRERVDYLEVTPETLWFEDGAGRSRTNAFCERFLALGQETGKSFVAHGVGLSLGTTDGHDEARFEEALARASRAHELFDFQWYTDHLAATVLGGENLILPLAVPFTNEVAESIRARLLRLQAIVELVGVENTVTYFNLADPNGEPEFLKQVLDGEGLVQVLDLHNLHTMALNHGVDVERYLAALPLERVIEIHISGGSATEPGWLPGGQTRRLDSHADSVPEAVWRLLETTLPRCSSVRGVTLERMEGTVTEADVEPLAAELERLRGLCA